MPKSERTAKLSAVYTDAEIRKIRAGKIVDVVLRRWYDGDEEPKPCGVEDVDREVEWSIRQINILPAGQPRDAPRWPSITYGEVTWNVNGTDVAMGDCPPPSGDEE